MPIPHPSPMYRVSIYRNPKSHIAVLTPIPHPQSQSHTPIPIPIPSPIAIGHTPGPSRSSVPPPSSHWLRCSSVPPPASHWSGSAPSRRRPLIGGRAAQSRPHPLIAQRQRRRLPLAEAQRAGAAVGSRLGPARLSPQPASLRSPGRPARHRRRNSTGTEPRHDGSGAELCGTGGRGGVGFGGGEVSAAPEQGRNPVRP